MTKPLEEVGPGDHVLGHVGLTDQEFKDLATAVRNGIWVDSDEERARRTIKVYNDVFGPDLPADKLMNSYLER
jgi:hypothetical protein